MNAPSRHVKPQKAGEAVFLRKAKRGVWRANVAREGLAATGGDVRSAQVRRSEMER